jgi:hypothetical protein
MESPLDLLVEGAFPLALTPDQFATLVWSLLAEIALAIGVFAIVPIRLWWNRRRSRAPEKGLEEPESDC